MKPAFLFLLMTLSLDAQRQMIFPGSAQPIGPYSPGILFDDVLYVSGQGARDAQGTLPASAEAQTRQCLDNIRAIVEAAHLTMQNIVYTHTYLANINDYDAVNRIYPQVFTGVLPARSTMGVARMPQDTPVEISAIAVKGKTVMPITLPNAASPVPISPGIMTQDRFFLSGILGRDAESGTTPPSGGAQIDMCLSRIARVLTQAALTSRHIAYLNVYRTAALSEIEVETRFRQAFPETAITILEVAALPFGVQVGVTGIAALNLPSKRVQKSNGKVTCSSVNRTVYCASESADTAGEALRALDESLKAMGSSLASTLSANVYLNDIETFQNMNAVYGIQFAQPFPTRTTVQPQRTGSSPAVRISLVAAVSGSGGK